MATKITETEAVSILNNLLIEQRNDNCILNARNKTLEMQIARLKEENNIKTNLIHTSTMHEEELNRKLGAMLSHLEQTFRGSDSWAEQEPVRGGQHQISGGSTATVHHTNNLSLATATEQHTTTFH